MKLMEHFFKGKQPEDHVLPQREDPRTYAVHGDVMWGNHISLSRRDGDGATTELKVWGHVSPRPRVADLCLVQTETVGWGFWIFTEVDLCRDPPDMFFGTIRGVIRAAEPEEMPKTKSATEFVKGGGASSGDFV